jgi:hypothetical protein
MFGYRRSHDVTRSCIWRQRDKSLKRIIDDVGSSHSGSSINDDHVVQTSIYPNSLLLLRLFTSASVIVLVSSCSITIAATGPMSSQHETYVISLREAVLYVPDIS